MEPDAPLGLSGPALWDMTMPQILKIAVERPADRVYCRNRRPVWRGAMAVGDRIEGVHADQLFLDVKTPCSMDSPD